MIDRRNCRRRLDAESTLARCPNLSIVPAFGTPSLGLPSFPNELLRLVLLHVDPDDLPILAAANRHLRAAIPACIDRKLARFHIIQTYEWADRSGFRTWRDLFVEEIPFNHPLLRFHHTVAAFSLLGISWKTADRVWGLDWQREPKGKARLSDRVQAVRAAVPDLFLRVEQDRDPSDTKLRLHQMRDLRLAIRMANTMKSVELLQDIHSVIPEAILKDPLCYAMEVFFVQSAEMGYMDGLALIPANYPLLKSESHDWLFPQAIRSKHLPAIQLLLEKGVAVTKCITKHMDFESERDYEILRLLLDHGFEPNWALKQRMYYLVKDDRYDILKLLLESGADPNAREDDHRGYTALHHCADVSEGHCLCMPLLFEAKADVDAVTKDGYTAVALACKARRADKVRILIDAGANLNVKACWPPLHTAVHHGAEDLVKLLLDTGAQVNFGDNRGKTPLHIALQDTEDTDPYYDVDIPMMLLEAGADPTIRCNSKYTPLHTLRPDLYGSSDTVRLLDRLVESGVNLDDDDGSRNTPWQKLCSAALRDRKLLEWGLAICEHVPDLSPTISRWAYIVKAKLK
ncbi:Ankyrin repeat and SOCS box protein 18 [Phlyctochytrium bullatum]|nr:Ankyrin repeat and SOCS box protein 18 [Phlyctochytrium bullatum]